MLFIILAFDWHLNQNISQLYKIENPLESMQVM